MAYVLSGRKCGTVRFEPDSGTVQKESMTKSSKMTSNAIENGSSIEDHVYKSPEQMQISGVVVGGMDGAEALENMWRQRDLITYVGKFRESNLIITNLKLDADKGNRNGCAFSATLQKVTIASSSYVEIGGIRLMSSQDGIAGIKSGGLSTTSSETVTANAYADYVSSYSRQSNNGPNARKTASYNGMGG